MARPPLPFAAVAALSVAVAACSNYETPRRPVWRSAAEKACLARKPFAVSEFIQPVRAIDGPGVCGLDYPFKVTALLDGRVRFNSAYTLGCPMIARLNAWLEEVVQPAARARFGQEVAEIEGMGAYSCRTMNNLPGGRISEHAFGNALDIGGFRLQDGREISILRDWARGGEETKAFLQDVHSGACRQFTTVLGPGSNMFHYNHVHLDLALHGNTAWGPRRICKPQPAPSLLPGPPRDNLPNPPEIDEEIDIAGARTPAEPAAIYGGPGQGPPAPIPDALFADALRIPAARAYAPLPPEPVGTPLRGTAPRAPEGKPADWDLTPRAAGQ
ncbi:MAG: extensin family protein [Methylocapsa sp.]|nr:extensin family protein [Methylocapsa sp.]